MARDQEVTAKFAVQEAQVKYERAVAAAAGNRSNSPDAKRDQAAVAKAKAELDAAVAMSKDPRNAVAPTAIEASSYNVRSTVGDEQAKKAAAAEAVAAATRAGIPTAKGAGGATDSQNEARLEAERKAALTPAGIAAAAIKAADAAVAEAKAQSIAAAKAAAQNVGVGPDAKADQRAAATAAQTLKKVTAAAKKIKINADPTVIAAKANQAAAAGEVAATGKSLAEALTNLEALTNSLNDGPSIEVTQALRDATLGLDTNLGLSVSIPTPTPTPEVDNFQESINAAAGMDSSSYAIDVDGNRTDITNVPFTGLTSEEQAAISGLNINQGLSVTSNLAVEGKGSYKQDITTGVLTLDGQPYNGSYNGFDYVDGIKYGATTKQVVNAGVAGTNTFSITGSDPTDTANADAFAVIRMILDSYGIGDELAEELIGYMTGGKGPEEAMLLIKQNPIGAYKKRFSGNELRIAAGLNVLDEKSYLELEDTYAETLRKYGLGNMLSTDRKVNQAMFAKYMGNDLNAPEFKDRIALATERVMNADAMTKGLFKQFYPNLTDADLVSYFLSPKDTLDRLKEKVTSAEIGGIALAQGLETDITSTIDLAKFGVDKAAAIEGYSLIKDVLPTSQKLGNVYQEAGIKYDQASGEAEFFKQNQDAKLKRKRLESLERGSFSASAGNASNAYKINPAGQI